MISKLEQQDIRARLHHRRKNLKWKILECFRGNARTPGKNTAIQLTNTP